MRASNALVSETDGALSASDPVANIDVNPTLLGLAGVPAGPTDGDAIFGGDPWRTELLLEHLVPAEGIHRVPTYCGVRTDTLKLIKYQNGAREQYDLLADPYEMDAAPASAAMRALLDQKCQPRPPGVRW
jgi:arylsulfatase A-like enzyme